MEITETVHTCTHSLASADVSSELKFTAYHFRPWVPNLLWQSAIYAIVSWLAGRMWKNSSKRYT
jgi:hypothetical protein